MAHELVFTKAQAQDAFTALSTLGFNVKLQTLKHPGMGAFADTPETIRGYSVSVAMRACEIDMATSVGYRAAPQYPSGFGWFCGPNGYNLTPYPGDSLETFVTKVTRLPASLNQPKPKGQGHLLMNDPTTHLNAAYLAMIWEQIDATPGTDLCEAYAIRDTLCGCCPGRDF